MNLLADNNEANNSIILERPRDRLLTPGLLSVKYNEGPGMTEPYD